MRKFRKVISFVILLAITITVIGVYASHRRQQDADREPSACQYTENYGRLLLCI